tara:strand:- start:2007 stop:2120 length:114 start_codon:yes stop_codon:yes gene_type:complete
MKILITFIIGLTLVFACGKKSDPQYQGKAKNQINIVL